ncbi:BPS1, chloroplastic-like protein [Tanacetum coccineum]
MGVFSRTSRQPIRSITMPCRSHPSTDRIDNVLNKVKTWESSVSLSNPSAEIVCSGLSKMTELYECFDDLVKTSLLKTSLSSSNQTKKWTDELLDMSVKFLDICSNATDVLSQTKQHIKDLECDLRRTAGCSMENIIAKYIAFRNKLKKDIKGSVASLKKLDNMIFGSPLIEDLDNIHLLSVIRVFRDVNTSSNVIFRLLLVFLASPPLKKKATGRRSAVSRFLSGTKVVPVENFVTNENELQCLDAALSTCSGTEKHEFIQTVQKKLQTMEASLENINSQLELMSRRQIAARASLLNMVSLY